MVSSLVYGLLAVALSGQTDCSVLYFQSAQCEPCRQFEPVLSQLQQQGWDVQKIEAPAQLELARQYQIKNLPTVVVLSGQREADRIVGVISLEQLTSRLSRVAARNRSASSQPEARPEPSHQAVSVPQNAVGSPSPKQNVPNQPIIRGQSPEAIGPGQAFPLLAANSSANRSFGANDSLPSEPKHADSAANRSLSQARPAVQPSAQLASATRLPTGTSGRSLDAPRLDRIPQQITLEQAIARAMNATVRIKVEESNTIAHGTGTIVDVHGDEALVLTCGHLFREMVPGSQLSVDLFAGTPRQVNLRAQLIDFKAEGEDIALLSVRLPVKLEPAPILPHGEAIQKGQRVFTIGCDHGNNPSRQDTKISNVNRYLGAANIEIEGAPAVGRSGGGMFDAQGRLLGVCNAACKEDNEGIYAGIEVVHQQLTRIGQAHLFAGSKPVPESKAQQEAVDANVVSGNSAGPQVTVASSNDSGLKNSTRWPDEDPRLSGSTAASDQTLELTPSTKGSTSTASELVCVIRDATGKQRVLTISQPSPELLLTIERQGAISR